MQALIIDSAAAKCSDVHEFSTDISDDWPQRDGLKGYLHSRHTEKGSASPHHRFLLKTKKLF
jgi:hypothetical protein